MPSPTARSKTPDGLIGSSERAFLALMLLPQWLTLGRVSVARLHEELHALVLRAAGAEPDRIGVRVRNPFGGSCVAEQSVLRRGEFLRMALAPAVVMGVPLAGGVVAVFLLGLPGIAGAVVRHLSVAMLVWHVVACWNDLRSARHVLRAGPDAYADVRHEGGALKVRAWSPGTVGTPGGRWGARPILASRTSGGADVGGGAAPVRCPAASGSRIDPVTTGFPDGLPPGRRAGGSTGGHSGSWGTRRRPRGCGSP